MTCETVNPPEVAGDKASAPDGEAEMECRRYALATEAGGVKPWNGLLVTGVLPDADADTDADADADANADANADPDAGAADVNGDTFRSSSVAAMGVDFGKRGWMRSLDMCT